MQTGITFLTTSYYRDIYEASLTDKAFDKVNAKGIANYHNEAIGFVLIAIKDQRLLNECHKQQKLIREKKEV
jgi:hypothetical protein